MLKEKTWKLIDRDTAIKMIRDSKGKIFGVTFVKRTTGDTRNMSARLGVSKGVTGEGQKYDPESKQLITVYDMHRQQYRMVNTETLSQLNMYGNEYVIAQVVQRGFDKASRFVLNLNQAKTATILGGYLICK